MSPTIVTITTIRSRTLIPAKPYALVRKVNIDCELTIGILPLHAANYQYVYLTLCGTEEESSHSACEVCEICRGTLERIR
jgi:hypothetical protein